MPRAFWIFCSVLKMIARQITFSSNIFFLESLHTFFLKLLFCKTHSFSCLEMSSAKVDAHIYGFLVCVPKDVVAPLLVTHSGCFLKIICTLTREMPCVPT